MPQARSSTCRIEEILNWFGTVSDETRNVEPHSRPRPLLTVPCQYAKLCRVMNRYRFSARTAFARDSHHAHHHAYGNRFALG